MIYRRAEAGDAAALSTFATRVFLESFERQVARAELEPFAVPRFAREKLADEIRRAGTTVFLALNPDIIGYAQVVTGNRPSCPLDAGRPAELTRIYVDAAWHGRGVAQGLMHLVEQEAIDTGCDALWLGVWDENARGRAFYDKCGFQFIGQHPIQVNHLSLEHHYLAKSL